MAVPLAPLLGWTGAAVRSDARAGADQAPPRRSSARHNIYYETNKEVHTS